MPELPEVTAYIRALEPRVLGQVVETVRIRTPSLLRTFDPRVSELEGRRLTSVRRVGKRIVFELEGEFFAVIHLMISGRLWWRKRGATIPKKRGHAAFDFPNGTLLLTEASTHKRASLHMVRGEEALAALDPGGVEPLEVDFHAFREALLRENRTLKRALTDPRILSGIGNAHSDEILLKARLSPVRRTPTTRPGGASATLRVDPPLSLGMGGAASYGFRRRVSREDHGVPRSDDGAREVRSTMPPVRCANPAHRVRTARDQLLPGLPDRRQTPQGPGAFQALPRGLAGYARRTRRRASKLGGKPDWA